MNNIISADTLQTSLKKKKIILTIIQDKIWTVAMNHLQTQVLL